MFHQKNTMPNRVSGRLKVFRERSRLSPHAAVLSSDFTCGSSVAKNRRCGKSRNTLNARNCIQAEEEEDAVEVTRCITRITCETEESTRKFERCITRTTCEIEESTRNYQDALRANSVFQYLCA